MCGYIEIAQIKEIPKNSMKRLNVKGKDILLVNIDGKFYAVEDRCPHMGYPLYFGSLEGEVLTCGFHYAKFNVRTGNSLGHATDEPLKTLRIRVQNSAILIKA